MTTHIAEEIDRLMARIEGATQCCDELTEEMLWTKHGTVLWKAKKFTGSPTFYPVFKHGDFYSYSLLSLILKKGYLKVNHKIAAASELPDNRRKIGSETIDQEIFRIGKAHKCGFKIKDVDKYAWNIANAMQKDISAVEVKHIGYKNLILCGGKDSMNLLLLQWKNPVIVLSAEPNYVLVKKFLRENNLSYEIIVLKDLYDKKTLEREVLEACCLADLRQWKWGVHLRQLASKYGKRVIFWQGHVAGAYTTTRWKTYVHPWSLQELSVRVIYKRLGWLLPFPINLNIGRKIQPHFIKATWLRGGRLQGCHNGFIREITDCLSLSAYHGHETRKIWEKADLSYVAQSDMRDLIGRYLYGSDVSYPSINPSPPSSDIRIGMSSSNKLLELLISGGINVEI